MMSTFGINYSIRLSCNTFQDTFLGRPPYSKLKICIHMFLFCRLHEDLKRKLQVNTVQCHILQGLIMGSGVNWAQDESLQKLLLETAQPDQL